MKLKLDGNGVAELKDGQPVYVHDDGKEFADDVPALFAEISALNGEAKDHRLAAKAATEELVAFAGIEDPAAAIRALATMANLDDKKRIGAGEAEKVRQAVVDAYEGKLTAAQTALAAKEGEVFQLMVGGAFGNSKFVGDKLTVPSDMVQAMLGSRFKVEEGRVVAYDGAGNKILQATP